MTSDQPSKHMIRAYWNSQILTWSDFRYGSIGRFLPQSWPIRYRLKLAAKIVNDYTLKGDLWIDLGCGTGVLKKQLGSRFLGKYIGIDSSREAINWAERVFSGDEHAEFQCENVMDFPLPAARGIVALGLTDWISPLDIQQLLKSCQCPIAIVSYTEKDHSSAFHIYKCFHFLKGLKRQVSSESSYPRSYAADEFKVIVESCGYRIERVSKTLFGPGRLAVLKRG